MPRAYTLAELALGNHCCPQANPCVTPRLFKTSKLTRIFVERQGSSKPETKLKRGFLWSSSMMKVLTDDRVDLLSNMIDFYPIGYPLSSGAARVGRPNGISTLNVRESTRRHRYNSRELKRKEVGKGRRTGNAG
uniref:Uncharacterized protein n=1 Tax=Solanum tuberosum TaxID=4113 RepID=M1DKX0_SOLTU